jgi:tetratricopeptide (TPR) repeat protein
MRLFLIGGLSGLLAAIALGAAGPAAAQTPQQKDWCYAASATDDQTIEGCTALINGGALHGRDLAIVYRDRAFSYFNKAQYDLAVSDNSQAIGLDPGFADAYDDRGNAFVRLGRLDQAIADYSQALKINPSFALAYSNRGYAYYLKSNADQALADLDESVRLAPNVGRAHINRALVYVMKGDCAHAADDYAAAKQLNWPSHFSDQVRAKCGAVIDAALSR